MTKTCKTLFILAALSLATPALANGNQSQQKSGCSSGSRSYTASSSSTIAAKPIAPTSSGFQLKDNGTNASMYYNGKFVSSYHASTSGSTSTWVSNTGSSVLARQPTPAGSQVVRNDAAKTITIPSDRDYTAAATKLWTARGYNVQTSTGSNIVPVNALH